MEYADLDDRTAVGFSLADRNGQWCWRPGQAAAGDESPGSEIRRSRHHRRRECRRGNEWSARQAGGDLARDDPRRDGRPAQRLVTQAGRSSEQAGGSAGPDRRASDRADPGDPPCRIRRARDHDRQRIHRQGDRPRGSPHEFRRLGLVSRRQAALRRRRVRRSDLPLRPCRGLAFQEDGLRLSRPQGVPGAAESHRGRRGQETSARAGGPGAHRRMARRFTSPPRSAIPWGGSTPNPERFKASSRSSPTAIPTAWRSTSRGSSSMSASGARPRWPSSTPTPSRSPATGRPRSTPTRCCWQGAARSCLSPTPTATPSA